ncbi:DUF4345 family protein [Mangrovibacterium lignilyticum]|uniref:DUF4345 family protein n=1 Tax=Mangrovibacterium lignilyticum TaxID=2668052 RepID=UPI0013D4F770|nr:DUF4345 family protein [Mangrovibacterium lignilyticum]
MKSISYFFFFTYVGLVTVAGFWGAFVNPVFDFQLLFKLDVFSLPESIRINLLSQYRFLRAIELGFGIFSLLFIKEIFSELKFNRLFLSIMAMGVLARVFSLYAEGQPSALFYLFLIWELLGVLFIFLYSRKTMQLYAG